MWDYTDNTDTEHQKIRIDYIPVVPFHLSYIWVTYAAVCTSQKHLSEYVSQAFLTFSRCDSGLRTLEWCSASAQMILGMLYIKMTYCTYWETATVKVQNEPEKYSHSNYEPYWVKWHTS